VPQRSGVYLASTSVTSSSTIEELILNGQFYLPPYLSTLLLIGPIGGSGPLGPFGPIGDNSWNPSIWMSGFIDWSNWVDKIRGPLSSRGPLGESGPLSYYWYNKVCPCIGFLGKQMMIGGLFTILGPLGPLGALGPLGPLGPVGAHGYAVNGNGQYTHNSKVITEISVPYDTTHNRTFPLYERYAHSFARSNRLDTSFLLQDVIYNASQPEDHSYSIFSEVQQFVSFLLVPSSLLPIDYWWKISVIDDRGKVVADGLEYVPWVVVKLEAGTSVRVQVEGGDTGSAYRLFVTGSTRYFNQSAVDEFWETF